jgi:RNA polymerase sigma factor (sigma-70 family)
MLVHVDKRFFAAVKSGDETRINKAFEQVYYEYVRLVAFIVGGYISDRETVKEVVNDVFLSLFNHAENVSGSVKYYLCVSAKNAAINRSMRDRKRSAELPLEYASERSEVFEPHGDVMELLSRSLNATEIEIVLKRVEGYTFREIAEKSGKNLNTVLTTYRRAVAKFEKEMKSNA